MPTDFELMKIHARALFTFNAESRLLFINEPGGATIPAPRLFLGRTQTGNVWHFRADVPANIIEELDELCRAEPLADTESENPPRHMDALVRLLERQSPVQKIWGGPAYRFPADGIPSGKLFTIVTEGNKEILEGGFEDLMADVLVEQPFVAMTEKNKAISVCRSVRITPEAHEAGLETLPAFRGKGYAPEVTGEWARRVKAVGVIPLYSTSWENKASQSVAGKLHLERYGTDFEMI